ncbi:hypothetical protein ACNUDN_05550 [Mycobacterium sp. smrl_JER01]|uniref:hypothetical protein n=1 Tax=Mycobacterium sp. smrl_JER01 TaxID=3402633 RepID=UPI003ABFCCBA
MRGAVVAVLAVCALLCAPACSRSNDGTPTAERTSTSVAPPAGTPPASAPGTSAPGVCAPVDPAPVQVRAESSDPSAPTATVGVPDGWSMASAPDGARVDGPDGMWATVTIVAAAPEAEAAFRTYVEDLTAQAVVSTVSLLPGDVCGYSGQKVMGMLTDGADRVGSVQYRARIVHVPSGGQNYLVAVYVEAPVGTAGFDDAAALMTGDFEIALP